VGGVASAVPLILEFLKEFLERSSILKEKFCPRLASLDGIQAVEIRVQRPLQMLQVSSGRSQAAADPDRDGEVRDPRHDGDMGLQPLATVQSDSFERLLEEPACPGKDPRRHWRWPLWGIEPTA
jgi:hypothetical protein